jgi:hypothetical protein
LIDGRVDFPTLESLTLDHACSESASTI